MAGFFYLGGGREGPTASTSSKNEGGEREESLYLYRSNEEIYNRGFEIWPAQYFQQNASSSGNNNNYAASFPMGRNYFNVYDESSSRSGSGGFTSMRQGGMNCQDCGNQAKKDCAHLRCRTCCKSRGFQCQTHMKSTWVPAAKRRERQQQLVALQQQQQEQQRQQQQQQRENPKRQRENQASLACSRFLDSTTSGLELAANFPAEVSSPAVFRCVKVTGVDDTEEDWAYQTAVTIGGHVFKGILYDQGPESRYSGGGESSQSQQQLNLFNTTTTDVSTAAAITHPTASMLEYPAPINAFIAGTQFFPPPRS